MVYVLSICSTKSEHSTLHSIATQILSAISTICNAHAHLLHASLNLPGMELLWNCGIPPKTPILFYSIPGRNTLTCIQYTFTLQSAKFQNHSNSDISIPKPWHLPLARVSVRDNLICLNRRHSTRCPAHMHALLHDLAMVQP